MKYPDGLPETHRRIDDPFDLSKVYLFKDLRSTETLEVVKLNSSVAENIPEEKSKSAA